MALGIVAFSLVAVFSLLSVSFTADRAAKDDTVLAEIAGSTINGLRSQPFASAYLYASAGPTLYFDAEGKGGMTPAEAVYQCTVSVVSDPAREGTSGPNLLRVRLDFRWPVGSAAGSQRIVQACLARYE